MIFRFSIFIYLLICYCGCLRRGKLTSVSIEHGKTATLSCCVGSMAEAFDWFYTDKRKKLSTWDKSGKYRFEVRDGDSMMEICPTIYIRNFQASDAGEYFCRTKVDDRVVLKIILTATIDVSNFKQTLVMDEKTRTGKIKVEVHGTIFPGLVWLRRHAKEYTPVAIFDGGKRKQTKGLPRYEIDSDGSLIIHDLTKIDEGFYQIEFNNTKEVKKEVISIKVEEGPRVFPDGTFVKSPTMYDYEVQVAFSGQPQPTVTCMTKTNEIIDKSIVTKLKDRLIAKLQIRTNSSFLTCDVINKHGKEKVRIELTNIKPYTKTTETSQVEDKRVVITGIVMVVLFCLFFVAGLVWAIYSFLKKRKQSTPVESKEITTDKKEVVQKKRKKKNLALDDATDVHIWLEKERQGERDNQVRNKRAVKKVKVEEGKREEGKDHDSFTKQNADHQTPNPVETQPPTKRNADHHTPTPVETQRKKRTNKGVESTTNDIIGEKKAKRKEGETSHDSRAKEKTRRKERHGEKEEKNESRSRKHAGRGVENDIGNSQPQVLKRTKPKPNAETKLPSPAGSDLVKDDRDSRVRHDDGRGDQEADDGEGQVADGGNFRVEDGGNGELENKKTVKPREHMTSETETHERRKKRHRSHR